MCYIRRKSVIEFDFAELAKQCMSVSPGAWVDRHPNPKSELRHEGKQSWIVHTHQSFRDPREYISVNPVAIVKVKNADELEQIWYQCYLKIEQLKKELLALENPKPREWRYGIDSKPTVIEE